MKEIRGIRIEESKWVSNIQKKAAENSFISKLGVKALKLKYGEGFFNYVDGEYSEINKLGTFSSSMEMPKTEITQPVQSAIIRMNFRLAKKENNETDN